MAGASDHEFGWMAPVDSRATEPPQKNDNTTFTEEAIETFENDHEKQDALNISEPMHNEIGAKEHTGPSSSERLSSTHIRPTRAKGYDNGHPDFVSKSSTHQGQALAVKDNTNPWAGRAILSLDGGIRGYSSLLILKSLMDMISKFEETEAGSNNTSPKDEAGKMPKDSRTPHNCKTSPGTQYRPYHYFDLIGGTSTGGLIAIMLGRHRLTVDECIREYKKLSEYRDLGSKIFGDTIKDLFSKLPREQSSPKEHDDFQSDPMRCKTVLCSMTINRSKSYTEPFLFRSYSLPSQPSNDEYISLRNPGPTPPCKIWEAACATSAATSYFHPFRLRGNEYIDATPFVNNPSWEVYKEYKALESTSSSYIDLFLSVGHDPVPPVLKLKRMEKMKSYFNLVNSVKEAKMTKILSDRVDHAVKESLPSKECYFRFSVDPGKKDSFELVKKATEDYLNQPHVKKMAEICALILVQARKRREKTVRWESFAEGTRYRCPICQEPSVFPTRVELKDHLQFQHGKLLDMDHHEEIQQLLNKGRVAYATSPSSLSGIESW